ncbi:hypothetical protein O8C76_10350 [Aliarcobacter butzleri]|uniref:Uncharacterized protein n=1 Tax=Aliarcobacter butzleri TaxID=28197 RepID=A0AAW7Q0H2_9BACT|nr:hypothetical protein [Aliarcobacter butzleri]MDN5071420.1 hypothetical protein [Aliarcobacter butzleri]
MKKGEAKVEFFSNIEYFKKEYEKGLVVSKFLYNKAVQEKNIKMKYNQFNKYFNDIFNKKDIILKDNIEINKEERINNEPIKAKVTTKENQVFSAMYGKKFKESDIL